MRTFIGLIQRLTQASYAPRDVSVSPINTQYVRFQETVHEGYLSYTVFVRSPCPSTQVAMPAVSIGL